MRKAYGSGGSVQSVDSCDSSDFDSDAFAKNSDFGMRSPGAATGGRSVKEIDEQLTNLRKENFNLKLRIYFLEERMGSNFNGDKEDTIKKNIELMVELENVRKDLEDKQELLCQAAKAIEIEEEEKKKEIMMRDEEISNLKEELSEVKKQFESEIKSHEENDSLYMQAFNLNMHEDKSTEVIKQLQCTIQKLQEELKKERERGDNFESMIEIAVENARTRCNHLEVEVEEKQSKLNDLTTELEEKGSRISSCTRHIEMLEKDLNNTTVRLQNTLVDLQQKDYDMKEYQQQIKELSNLFNEVQLEKEKTERRADKYKTLLSESENKNAEMVLYTENLKSKIQNLEIKLESALDEVKRNNKTENVISTDQKSKSNNTDPALFSVRKTVPETSKAISSKNVSKINHSSKSSHSTSPPKSASSHISYNSSDNRSFETCDISPHRPVSDTKPSSITEISSEGQLSQEEFLELKKNHYKACKMIKAMIQNKNQHVEQISNLQTTISTMADEIQRLKNKIVELTECDGILCSGEKKKSIQEMVSELKLTANPNPAANKETSMAGDEMHLAEQYKEVANELEKKIEVLNATLNEKDCQLERLKIDLQTKANRIIDLEFELLALNQGVKLIDSSGEKEDALEKLIQEKLEKENEIKRLDSELRKRTCDLQGIVNKELWEKNRTIEKMQTILKSKDLEIGKLEKNVCGKELQLKILKDKINELGVHVNLPPGLITIDCSSISCNDDSRTIEEQLKVCLEERKHFMCEIEDLQKKLKNTPEHDENRQIMQLKAEYKDLREELEKSEKLRQESQEICSVLSTRLEELCYFLDSLLKHKAVLGFLGSEQMRKLRHVVDKSLDLSRTLSTTMSLNPDQSLLQLSNISNLLNSTRNDNLTFNDLFVQDEENNSVLSIIPSDVTLTYQSHLNRTFGSGNEQAEVIKVLRNQIANLKREIELRDIELGKKLTTEPMEAEKPLENDEEFVDALVDIQQCSVAVTSPETVLQKLVEDASKLNVTSSTLVGEKSNVNTTSTTLKNYNVENQSESESWSEPDRTVSMARIGLHDESLKRPSSGRRIRFGGESELSTDSTEEQIQGLARTPSKRSTLSESRQTIISLHEQVCELETRLKEKENQLLAAQVAFYEADNLLKQEQTKIEEAKLTNSQLTTQITNTNKKLKDNEQQKQKMEREIKEVKEERVQLLLQIKETNSKLDEAETQKFKSEQRIADLQKIVAVLEEFKGKVETTMDLKDKEMQNVLNQMEIEKSMALASAKNAERLLSKAKNDMEMVETELQNMHKREQKIREELEQLFRETLKKTEEEYVANVKTIEQNYEAQANKCREAVMKIKESYEKDYIKRSEVDKRMIEIQEITKEVENLKRIIQECEKKMREMEENEMELKTKVLDVQQEHQDKLHELQKDLDNATLQYSEAILEKTKLQNENSGLEDKVQKFYLKETELIREVNELYKEFEETQANLHAQVSQLEHQKSLLDLKVSDLKTVNAELQSANAELRNRLVRLQFSKSFGDTMAAASLPNNLGNIIESQSSRTLPIPIQNIGQYVRQMSDHSGYTSEDLLGVGDIDNERAQASSSPDLGIESDHGRFSSLEANVNIPRPLLPTLELTQSMSNLLDSVQDESCASDQCCKKMKQMASENVELRKRLLRTRRALEETLNRLTMANRQKKEVEKSICKQIHKTSQVLRKAKANLDSGSETDILKNPY